MEQRVACENSGFKMARSVRMGRFFIIFALKSEEYEPSIFIQ